MTTIMKDVMLNNNNTEPFVACCHCKGTGREFTVEDIWPSVAQYLRRIGWSDADMAAGQAQMRPGEILDSIPDEAGFDVLTPAGKLRRIVRPGFPPSCRSLMPASPPRHGN
jgi:hypothetical protein